MQCSGTRMQCIPRHCTAPATAGSTEVAPHPHSASSSSSTGKWWSRVKAGPLPMHAAYSRRPACARASMRLAAVPSSRDPHSLPSPPRTTIRCNGGCLPGCLQPPLRCKGWSSGVHACLHVRMRVRVPAPTALGTAGCGASYSSSCSCFAGCCC